MKKKRIKLAIRTTLLVGTIVSLMFVPWILVKAWILPLPDTIQEQVDEAVGHGLDGMIVYVQELDKPAVFYTSGWHDREKRIPSNPKALFKIASISKLYTATAITKLVNSEKLSLDKTVADYFPDIAERIEYSDKITLKHLVQHRSGIPNYTDTPSYWANPAESYTAAVESILDKPANFEPNTDYEYSNTNYLLLSKLIEKTSGKQRFEYIKEEILNPLQLHNTYLSINDVDLDLLAEGYHVGVDESIKTSDYGSMIATAEDVGVFLRALGSGEVFKEGGDEIYSSIYEYEHGGWIPGYQSQVKYYKATGTVIVQFNNTTDDKLYNWNLSEIVFNRIAKILNAER